MTLASHRKTNFTYMRYFEYLTRYTQIRRDRKWTGGRQGLGEEGKRGGAVWWAERLGFAR